MDEEVQYVNIGRATLSLGEHSPAIRQRAQLSLSTRCYENSIKIKTGFLKMVTGGNRVSSDGKSTGLTTRVRFPALQDLSLQHKVQIGS
jgi:hypothetical protein